METENDQFLKKQDVTLIGFILLVFLPLLKIFKDVPPSCGG